MYDDSKLKLMLCREKPQFEFVFDRMKEFGQLQILFPYEPPYRNKKSFVKRMMRESHLFLIDYKGTLEGIVFLNNFKEKTAEVSFALFGSLKVLVQAGSNIADYFLGYCDQLIAVVNLNHAIGHKYVQRIGFKHREMKNDYYGKGKGVNVFIREKTT